MNRGIEVATAAAPPDCDLVESPLAISSPPAAGFDPELAATGASPIRNSKEKLRLRLYTSLFFLDIFCIAASFALANLIRFGEPLHPQGLDMLVVLLPIFIGLAFSRRAYTIECLTRPREGIRRVVQSLLIASAIVVGIIFYMKISGEFSRLVFGIGTAFSLASLSLSRWTFGQRAGAKCHWSFVNEILLVDGVPVYPDAGQIVIFADQADIAPSTDDPVILDRIGRLLHNCDRVVLACAPDRRLGWSRLLKGMDVDVELLAPELKDLGALAMRSFNGRSTLLLSCGPLGLRDRALKRALDLAIAAPALVILSPLLLAVAAAVKLETPGPVFFRQARVGRGNRIFEVLKFRSMRVEAADRAGHRSASLADDRITAVGRFIRRTSIDELPQLINVVRGNMSIVGPRPHALASTAENALFWQLDARYIHRHAIKPGMTGLAQVRGFRGATLSVADLTNRLQADLEYLSGWTIWRDVRIIFRTFRVLKHSNAF
jgi:lipopolysaccharide/colanic/teichoic acid biosynthesis glycosyltransferase